MTVRCLETIKEYIELGLLFKDYKENKVTFLVTDLGSDNVIIGID